MPVRIWAAAAALLAPAAEGLAAQAFLGAAVVEPDATPEDGMRSWLERAEKANEGLDEELRKVMSELASTARQEKDPRTKKEQQLQMLEDLLKQYDTENETSIDETSKRMAAIAFRKAIRNHIRKPHRKSGKADTKPGDAVDRKMADEFSEWVQEANRATHDLEKQLSADESDLGLPKPKSAEEKSLDRVADLIDEVDPKNASEMADLGEALAQERRPKQVRKAKRHARSEPTEEDARMVEAMKEWVLEADKASRELERSAKREESDLGDAKPKGEEERSLERVADLIDEVDPKNASEMADLADALAQVQRPKRKAARHASQSLSEADSTIVEAMRSWIAEANKASQDFEREARHEESDLGDAKPKGEEEKSLERVADLIDGVDPKNASELADLGEALSQRARTLEGKLAPRSDPPTEPARPVADEARRWMAEADQATSDIDREIDEAIDELIAGPKSAEERELERIQRLIDSTDPENATDVADLAASLATSSSFTRRVVKFPADWKVSDRSSFDWSKDQAKKFWAWLKKAEEESEILDQDLDASEAEFQDYLKNMTSAQQSVMHMGLKALEEMWEKYDFDNETATAEDVMERVQLHRVRRTQ